MAQPTLTAANSNFAIGDIYYSTSIDAAGISPGPAGANVTWDFSQYSPTGTTYTITVRDVAGSQYQTDFQGATVYSDYSPGANREFFITNSNEWSRKGIIADGATTINYSDPHKILSYPFTYNSSLADTYTAIFTTSITLNRQGNTTSVADAYGTITLPGGQTVTDVLRVKLVENSADSYMGTPVFSSSTENY